MLGHGNHKPTSSAFRQEAFFNTSILEFMENQQIVLCAWYCDLRVSCCLESTVLLYHCFEIPGSCM